jgi:hypothetical protein
MMAGRPIAFRQARRHTGAVEQGKLQGWQADPFGLHEKRYFSDGQPTKLVRDGAVESYDEPPGGELAPSAATTEPAANGENGTAQDAASAAGAQPDDAEPVSPELDAIDGTATQAEPEPVLAMAGAATAAAAEPAESVPETASLAAEPAVGAQPLTDANDSADESPYRGLAVFVTRRRSGRVYAIVGAAAVVVILAIVAIAGGFSSGTPNLAAWNGTGPAGTNAGGPGSNAEVASLGMAPAAFVTTSAHKTLAKKTAAVTLLGSALVAGHVVEMHGTGQVDLAHNAVSITISGSYPGATVTETEILTGGKFYLQVSANGKALTWANGHKHWMEIPIAQTGAQYVTSAGPVSPLRLLEQQGARVTAIGTRNIGGMACSGFSVTPTKQAAIAGARQEWAHLGLTKAQEAVALRLVQASTPPTITIWFDPRHRLECGATVEMRVTSPGSTAATSTQLMMTFTHYGVPVHIEQPATSDSVLF